ncbi:MAG: hypothetical protein P1U58_11190 [Verrucomicrobiales bacterium]|nr:hypothetical protein [Verrucomicrobiales bacterium]
MHPTAIVIAFLDQIPVLNPAIGDSLRNWIESTPVEGWIVLGLVAFIAMLLGRLSVRRSNSSGDETAAIDADLLRWRHEKLILFERQENERLVRQSQLQSELEDSDSLRPVRVKLGLSHLAEEAREIRQRIGTDYSRLGMVKSKLQELAGKGAARPEAMKACMEIADSQLVLIEGAREQMRPVSQELNSLDESYRVEAGDEEAERERIRSGLTGVEKLLSESTSDWEVLRDEADRQIRDILSAGSEKYLQPICDILLVDGGATDSIERGSEVNLSSCVEKLLELLEESEAEPPHECRSESDLVPSTEFSPASVEPHAVNGHHERVVSQMGSEQSVSIDEPKGGELVLFRSNDVSLWGRDIYRGANERARSLEVIPDWADWISIRRLDTGDVVYTSTDGFSLSNSETPGSVGFNGSHELFYGARHLGMYSDACPNEVETRFTYGGWGFGHRVSEINESGEALQASGWAGKEIPAETVFEIVLHTKLPDQGEGNLVLARADSGGIAVVGRS